MQPSIWVFQIKVNQCSAKNLKTNKRKTQAAQLRIKNNLNDGVCLFSKHTCNLRQYLREENRKCFPKPKTVRTMSPTIQSGTHWATKRGGAVPGCLTGVATKVGAPQDNYLPSLIQKIFVEQWAGHQTRTKGPGMHTTEPFDPRLTTTQSPAFSCFLSAAIRAFFLPPGKCFHFSSSLP